MPLLTRSLSGLAAAAAAALSIFAQRHQVHAPDARIVFSGRIVAHGNMRLSIHAGVRGQSLLVQGDGSSDLDCWLYDASGSLVDAATNSVDRCDIRAATSGVYHLIIRNYGSRANELVVEKL